MRPNLPLIDVSDPQSEQITNGLEARVHTRNIFEMLGTFIQLRLLLPFTLAFLLSKMLLFWS